MVADKQRAGRNRTLTVDDAERALLRQDILGSADVAGGQELTDRFVNADFMDVVRFIPDGFAHLIIVDPPYNLSKTFNASRFASRSDEAYADYLRSWFYPLCAKLRPGGSLYMCGDWRCSAAQQRVIAERLTVLNRITWQREKGRGAAANWKNAMEDIWFAVADRKDYYFNVEAVKQKRRVLAPYRRSDGRPKDWEETQEGNFRLTCPSNFWDDISVPFWSMPENTDHPTQKPEKLIAKLVLASSRPGDIVLDPFAGSGTTCVVAKKLGRHYLGVELDGEYSLWAAKRLRMADGDKQIQGYSGGCFWERNTPVARQDEGCGSRR